MQQTGELNCHGNIYCEKCKVVVDVVERAVRGVDLRVELTNHSREKDHGESRTQEHVGEPVRKSPKFGILNGASRNVNGEDNHNNHELTTQEVAMKVVATKDKRPALVGMRVAVFVQFSFDRRQTNQGSLASFHHGEPNLREPNDNKGKTRMDIRRDPGLFGEDQAHNDADAEDKKAYRDNVLDESTRIRQRHVSFCRQKKKNEW